MTFFIGILKKFFLSWTINSVVVSNVWNICLHAFSYLTQCFSMWNVLYLFLSSIFFPFQLCGYVPSFSLNVPYFMVPTHQNAAFLKQLRMELTTEFNSVSFVLCLGQLCVASEVSSLCHLLFISLLSLGVCTFFFA